MTIKPYFDPILGAERNSDSSGGGGDGLTYTQTFDDSDLTAGILTINHALGTEYVSVTIRDSSNAVINPDNNIVVDSNNVEIDLTSFGAIAGTWTAFVVGG